MSDQWADQVRSQKQFSFTSTFHFINAEGKSFRFCVCRHLPHEFEYQTTLPLPVPSILRGTADPLAVSVSRSFLVSPDLATLTYFPCVVSAIQNYTTRIMHQSVQPFRLS